MEESTKNFLMAILPESMVFVALIITAIVNY